MEPFGLLNFIKSALSLAAEQPTNDEPTLSREPPPTSTAAEPIENTPPPKSHNAFLAFVDKHESQAKKLRK